MAYARGRTPTVLTILVIALLATLWVLALRYGYDSRDGARSKDQELASYGMSWRDLA